MKLCPSPCPHHDSAPSRPHPLICTGAEPINPVHCPRQLPALSSTFKEIEKFIIRQPPQGEKDDYDSENSWISDGLPSSSNGLSTEKQLSKILIGWGGLAGLQFESCPCSNDDSQKHFAATFVSFLQRLVPTRVTSVVVVFHRAAGVWQTA